MALPSQQGHVLVVDDDVLVRDYLRLRLRAQGFTCSSAANGLEAIEDLRRHELPDVILLDLKMPKVDGMEFLRLAQHYIGPAFGVIVMSGDELPRLKEQVMRYGALTLVGKPIDFGNLLRLIRIQQDYRRTCANLR